MRDPYSFPRPMHVHCAPQHSVSRGTKCTLLNSIGVPSFAVLAHSISKFKVPLYLGCHGISETEVPKENSKFGRMAGLKLSGKQIFHLVEQLFVILHKLNCAYNTCCNLGNKERVFASEVLLEACAILQLEDVHVQMCGRLFV